MRKSKINQMISKTKAKWIGMRVLKRWKSMLNQRVESHNKII